MVFLDYSWAGSDRELQQRAPFRFHPYRSLDKWRVAHYERDKDGMEHWPWNPANHRMLFFFRDVVRMEERRAQLAGEALVEQGMCKDCAGIVVLYIFCAPFSIY